MLEGAAREPVRLNAELTKVMVHVEIGPAHAVGLRHRPKNGMHVRLVFGGAKSVKQGAQIGYICRKLLWPSATLVLVNFRPRRESWPPFERQPQSGPLQGGARQQVVNRPYIFFTEKEAKGIVQVAHHLSDGHDSPVPLQVGAEFRHSSQNFFALASVQQCFHHEKILVQARLKFVGDQLARG